MVSNPKAFQKLKCHVSISLEYLFENPSFVADRLLQGHHPRHTLVKQSSQPADSAFSAFNPPKDVASASVSDTPDDEGNPFLFTVIPCYIVHFCRFCSAT